MRKSIATIIAAVMAVTSFSIATVDSADAAGRGAVIRRGGGSFHGGHWSGGGSHWSGGGRYHGGGRYYGYRGGYRNYGYRDNGAAVAAGIAGLAVGAIAAGALSNHGGSSVDYCRSRFKSYNPASGTYLGYDGLRHSCP